MRQCILRQDQESTFWTVPDPGVVYERRIPALARFQNGAGAMVCCRLIFLVSSKRVNAYCR